MTQPTQSEIDEAVICLDKIERTGFVALSLTRKIRSVLAATKSQEYIKAYREKTCANYKILNDEISALKEKQPNKQEIIEAKAQAAKAMCEAKIDGKRVSVIQNKWLQTLIDTNQPTCVTVDELADCQSRDVIRFLIRIASRYPNGIRIIPTKQGD